MNSKPFSAIYLRLAALLLPPAGLLLLWKGAHRHGRKIFGTIGILLYCIPYTVFIVWMLVRFTGLEVEWRGGYMPAFTYHKTAPNYEAVEKSRTSQSGHASIASTNLQSAITPAYWTDFRGPNRDGHYDEMPILTNWPATGLRALWDQPIGAGYGSFVVAEGLAFTIEQRRDIEMIVAYGLATGREVWTNGWHAFFQESMGGDGPRATPTYYDGKLYVQGAEGEFRCIEAATGKLIWSKNILQDNGAMNLYYGMASSPLIIDDKVIIQAGGANGKSVVAYNRSTGETVWKALDDPSAYASPMTVDLAGQRQLLIVTSKRAVGLSIADGRLLWEHPWVVKMENRNIAQPVILSTNRFFLSAGYGTGCEAVEISRNDTGFSARSVWKNKLLKNKFSSSVFWKGCIYGLDEDLLTCLNADTGERRWKDGRYGFGQLILADGHLVILSGEGQIALVRAIPDRWEELARFPAIQGKTWNHPCLAQGKLLVRNAVEMACFDLTAP
ncbi:MAG: WD40-like repeat-like protein [Pedosphaera sp.]|nr:WD40-like repeat-like protein [Pedosphaera sp.]